MVFIVYAVLSVVIFVFMFSRLRKMRGYEMEAHHRKQQLEIAKREAELSARDIRSQAEENAQKRIAEAEKMIEERKAAAQKIEQAAAEVQARATELSVKLDERLVALRRDEDVLAAERKSLDELREHYENKLLEAAKLSRREAREAAVAL